MRSWSLASLPVPLEAVPADQVEQGAPSAGDAELLEYAGLDVGVWEITEGVSTDVEVDELSVVLGGRGTLTINGRETVELEPGVLFRLDAGDRTTWSITERLRKLYLLPPDDGASR